MNLPPLYTLDDYWSCVENGNDYCTFLGSLTSTCSDNPVWNRILAYKSNKMLFDRSFLHRGLCIPKEYSGKLEIQKQYSEAYLNKEVRHLNLTANVENFLCIRDANLITYDYIILGIVLLYLIFFIAVSIFDKWIIGREDDGSLVWNFSVFHNWEKVVNGKNGRDYEKLKCVQGLRFLLMLGNIATHTGFAYNFVYLDDPVFFEKQMDTLFSKTALAYISHMVQPFFLISSFLCTLHIYNIYEENGKFTFKDLVITILNRYFRLLPCVAFVSILLSTEWVTMLSASPNVNFLFAKFKTACEDNMLSTLFFVNNYNFAEDVCNTVTWYVSVDFQFFVITAALVYLILKYNWSIAKVTAIGISLTCLIYGLNIYAKDLDIVFRPYIGNMELAHIMKSVPFRESYTSSHSSLTTPLLGLMFGFIYVMNRHRTDLHKNKRLQTLWYILGYGLFGFTLYLTTRTFNSITNAILGPLMKPMFAFSFGVLILGMTHNIGGNSKRLLETRFFQIMGDFSFGAYIMHFPFCFTRAMIYFTTYDASRLYWDCAIDVVSGFIFGALLCLSLEQPASVLQKIILPQIKKYPFTRNSGHPVSNRVDDKGKPKLM